MGAEFIPDASNTDQILLVGTQTGAAGGEKIGFRNVGAYDAAKNLLVGLRNSVGVEPIITNGGLADASTPGMNSLVTAALSMRFTGSGYDRVRVANKSARVAFTAAASVVIATPGAAKKLNPQGRVTIAGITAGEQVDLRDGGIAGTIIDTVKADAQGNAFFLVPEGGTSGRLAAVNNTLAATWTTATSGAASVKYNEE
ncbi:MAG: hypothetical protein JWN15_2175 [Firmicutes bacterium]|nr:hypothetical protein [Bacillota bacterium]